MLLLILVLTGLIVGTETFKAFRSELKTVDLSLGYQKMNYFFDLIGYAHLYDLNITVSLPPGTSLLQSDGDGVYLNINGTVYHEEYGFPVFSSQVENTSCVEINNSQAGVIINQSDKVKCAWLQS